MIQVLGRLGRQKWNDQYGRRFAGHFLEAQHSVPYGNFTPGHRWERNQHTALLGQLETRNKEAEQGEQGEGYCTVVTWKQAFPNHLDDSQKPGWVGGKKSKDILYVTIFGKAWDRPIRQYCSGSPMPVVKWALKSKGMGVPGRCNW